MSDPRTLKSQVDLVWALTQEGLSFRWRGANAFALCPFHTESTPSFAVNPRAQLWHCFGCGAGGDIYTFLRKRHGCTFGEALNTVARWVESASQETSRSQ